MNQIEKIGQIEKSENVKSEIMNLRADELAVWFAEQGEPRYRAKQTYSWIYNRPAFKDCGSFDEMTNLPPALREKLKENFRLTKLEVAAKQVSKDGTEKYLFTLYDGQSVECVLMRYHHGNSACISTQVGCRMGCAFCASTKGGLVRSLSSAEMLAEIFAIERESGERISSLVLMGTGEPLDNMDNVLRFISLLTAEEGVNLGARHISLSTCGICPKIDALAEQKLQITLSVSLHAPTNDKRNAIMPINRAYPIERLMESCKSYFAKTGRRISYEYAMIKDFNDGEDDAKILSRLLRGGGAHVNLIPLNRVKESPFLPSEKESVARFLEILASAGITATVRRRLGSDIDAACGQLRAKRKQNNEQTQ